LRAPTAQHGAATQQIARKVQPAAAGTHDVTSNIGGVKLAGGVDQVLAGVKAA
jgi:hypothetical protein